jgi:hypothetical protein
MQSPPVQPGQLSQAPELSGLDKVGHGASYPGHTLRWQDVFRSRTEATHQFGFELLLLFLWCQHGLLYSLEAVLTKCMGGEPALCQAGPDPSAGIPLPVPR